MKILTVGLTGLLLASFVLGEAYAHLGEMLREQEESALFGKTRWSAEELGQRVADARAQVAALEVVK